MAAEVAFLVFILYFILFLDLCNSFTKLLNANDDNTPKKSSLSKKKHWRGIHREELPRNNLVTYDYDKNNIFCRSYIFMDQRSSTNIVAHKNRLWGG